MSGRLLSQTLLTPVVHGRQMNRALLCMKSNLSNTVQAFFCAFCSVLIPFVTFGWSGYSKLIDAKNLEIFLPEKHSDVKPEDRDFYCTANLLNVLFTSCRFDRLIQCLKPLCNAIHELIIDWIDQILHWVVSKNGFLCQVLKMALCTWCEYVARMT